MSSDDMKIDIAKRKLDLEKQKKREKQEKEREKSWDRVRKWQDKNHAPKELEEADGDNVEADKLTDDGFRSDAQKIDDGFRDIRKELRKLFFPDDPDAGDGKKDLRS